MQTTNPPAGAPDHGVPERRDQSDGTPLDELVFVLDPDQCWSHLRSARTARIASRTDESLEVIPLNFVAEDRRLFFGTSSNVILGAVYGGREIVMEMDEHDGLTAWSVVVRGTVHIPDAKRHRLADAVDARHAETSHHRAGADQHHEAALQPSCSMNAVSDDERSAPPLIRPSLSPWSNAPRDSRNFARRRASGRRRKAVRTRTRDERMTGHGTRDTGHASARWVGGRPLRRGSERGLRGESAGLTGGIGPISTASSTVTSAHFRRHGSAFASSADGALKTESASRQRCAPRPTLEPVLGLPSKRAGAL